MPLCVIAAITMRATKSMSIRTYSELVSLSTLDERFDYLNLNGIVGDYTFGSLRYLNQALYTSTEWRKFRDKVIVRDNGCEMAHPDYPIGGRVIIHHLNPLTPEDVENRSPEIFSMENVVCVSLMVHDALHYGDKELIPKDPIVRSPYDTCPWR